ncbi:MAG: hypothetical protein PHQ05_12375 [Sterolibacterium sp.]|nr:hypothetical protein [Sterolibacterium sp.]
MILRISLFSLAALLLGAHFFRAGDLVLVTLCLLMPLLFFVRKRGTLILLQFLAYCAAAIWIAQAAHLAALRQLAGQPWVLAVAILGGIAIFTFLVGMLLNSRSIRRRYDK